MVDAERFICFQTGFPLALKDAIGSHATTADYGTVTLSQIPTSADITSDIIAIATPLAQKWSNGLINKFRNGTLDIWQRGTSITVSGTYAYTADGWMVQSNGANSTISQQTGRLNSIYCCRITGQVGVTTVNFKQRIESYLSAPLTSKNCTIQLYLYNNTGSSFTPTLTVTRANAQDSWGAATTLVNAVNLQPCSNAVWTQLAYTFATDSSTANGLQVEINIPSGQLGGAGLYIQFAELDIRYDPYSDLGLNSTPPFPEFRPIEIEDLLCQRYLPGFISSSIKAGTANGQAFSSSEAIVALLFRAVARTAITGIILSSVNDWAWTVANLASNPVGTSLLFNNGSVNSVQLYGSGISGSPLVAGNASQFYNVATTAKILCTGAEL